MQTESSANFHVVYQDVTSQHWHPGSERFAGGDHLMTALRYGWKIESCTLKSHWFGEMRAVQVYEFTLKRKDETLSMPVVGNPYIYRFVMGKDIELIEEQEH